MFTAAKILVEAFETDSEGFAYFSDYLDQKQVDERVSDLARDIFARKR